MESANHSSEGHSSSAHHARNVKGGWRSVKYILGNETFEKLASMSLIANLVVYLTTQYNMDNIASAEVFNIWSGSANFLPILGAYIADAHVGKYHVLLFGSLASFLGMGLMALGAGLPTLRPHSCIGGSNCPHATGYQLAVLYLALGLLAIGSGGLRPCNIAFGVDQFDTSTAKGRSQLESFLNWWYFLFTLALLVALTGVVYVMTSVSWFVGFIIPTVCFAFSTTIFLLGRHSYALKEPKGSLLRELAQVITAAIKKRRVSLGKDSDHEPSFYDPTPSESEPKIKKLTHTNRFICLDKAAVITDPNELDNQGKPINGWRLCSVTQVEELKCIVGSMPVWLAGIGCFLPMQQMGSFGMLQGIQMQKAIGSHFKVPPAWMGLMPMITLSIWIYLYEKIYIPWTMKSDKKEKRLSIETRIKTGIVFSFACMVVGGLVEVQRRGAALRHGTFESPLSIWWLVPQFALSGLVEAFAAISMMELLTTYWPEPVKTLGGAFFFLSFSITNFLSSILIKIILTVSRIHGKTPWLGGNDLNKNKLEYFYYTIAVLSGLNLLYFQFYARHFLSSEVLQRQTEDVSEDEENQL
ncbi:hypothetical protein L6164_000544 [Bauhinia variegata]|uniref:Uncharacterized protein n=1 Tax=Bauhinia variegata TaxID=167791 RepID=A0ACB9Q6Z5_BAUVA|nr:hypothetical protein L6164_000544 [Bauhinia variegata]